MSYPMEDLPGVRDELPVEVRMAICRDHGHHTYAPSSDVREFTRTPIGLYERRVPCTTCRVAVRIEVWDLRIKDGKIVDAKLATHYPGVVKPDTAAGRLTREDIRRGTS